MHTKNNSNMWASIKSVFNAVRLRVLLFLLDSTVVMSAFPQIAAMKLKFDQNARKYLNN